MFGAYKRLNTAKWEQQQELNMRQSKINMGLSSTQMESAKLLKELVERVALLEARPSRGGGPYA